MSDVVTLPDRKDLERKYTWNAESVFATPEDWEAEFEATSRRLPDLERHKGHLGDSAESLLAWFQAIEGIRISVGKLQTYAVMSAAVDARDQVATARQAKVGGLNARVAAAAAFEKPELLALPAGRLQQLLGREELLRAYEHYLDRVERGREHVRNAEVEELLGAVQDPFRTASQSHGLMVNADLKFAPAVSKTGERSEVTHSLGQYSSPDRELRRSAWESYADGHLAFKNTFANMIAAGAKQDWFNARARRYGSSLEAALDATFIPGAVYRNLIDTYRKNLPTWHKYWSVRRRVLHLDKHAPWDDLAPLSGKSPEVPYEKAVEFIVDGMRPLGDEYVTAMRHGLTEERWVDVFPNQGKRLGAFSSGSFGTHPFIMMSFRPELTGMSTLAHEIGHSMHSYLSRRNQPFQYSAYGLFVAEVASNFNQAMVRANLLNTQKDPDFRIAVILEAMSNFRRYFMIMPVLALFELEVHERVERGQALTADTLNNLMADLLTEAYGPDVELPRERAGIMWAQFSTHLYSNFYVYQYATGISAAHALSERVLSGGTQAAEGYLSFLRAGGSVYPLDVLKIAGIDMTSPQPVEQTFAVLSRYVDELERLTTQEA